MTAPPADVAGLLAGAAAASPAREALVEPASGRRVTWSALDEEVSRVAAGFGAAGLVPGHRVLICAGNRVEMVTAYLAALRARLVAVPVSPHTATGELVRILADSGARMVVADATAAAGARAAVAGLRDALEVADEELRRRTPVPRLVMVGTPALAEETAYGALPAEVREGPPAGQDPEALAVLAYTSGSTGRPRAAMLSSRALLANIRQLAAVPVLTGDDVVLGMLPLGHVQGFNAVLGQALLQRTRVVLVEERYTEGGLASAEAEAVSVVAAAPAVLQRWVEDGDPGRRLRSVRWVLSGPGRLDPGLAARFRSLTGLTVHQGYGLTEAAGLVTCTLHGGRPETGSLGRALPGVRLDVVDDAGAAPAPGDPGEIRVAGDSLFSGYWPDAAEGPDADGWWRTGDLGVVDDEGELFLVERVKDVVTVSGFHVYPGEVEEVVAQVAGVAEAAVVGVPDPDTGEALVAFVRRGTTPLSEDEVVRAVHERCAERLPRYKRPRAVEVVDDLPHTATGGVARERLRSVKGNRWRA